MKTVVNSSRTLSTTSRKPQYRPNSASRKNYIGLKINSNSDTPPPIIFTMPNNPKKLSGMGNKIEREQLYEYNMQLKDIINKLKRELAETRNQVVKKDIEIRKKEKLIKEVSKENDIESVHELNLEKARESTLVSLCKDKYKEIKKEYLKTCEENNILKANIKITKIKEYQIQIDVLKKEMEKLRNLYLNTLDDNNKLNKEIQEIKSLKQKFYEQHNIINNFIEKCNQYDIDINNLKEKNSFLQSKLEQNNKLKNELKNSNFKLKISNEKFLKQKKLKENFSLNQNDNQNLIEYLKKERDEYKRLYKLKNEECNKMIEMNTKRENEEIKRKKEKDYSLKPFNYNNLIVIENKKEDKDYDKVSLYKSLLDESRHKNEIYELYLKKTGIDKDKLIKAFGYDGVMNSNTKINPLDIVISEDNANPGDNANNGDNANKNLISTESNPNTNPNNNIIISNNEEVNKEDSIRNINNPNVPNSISNTSNESNKKTNANTISRKLPSIEEEKQDEDLNKEESQLLSLLHVFVKNLEAQGITKNKISQKIEEICKIFENKEEATKEEFIEPFTKMFIETMKITQEKDVEIVNNFLSDFVDSLNGETVVFFNGLIEVFDNIRDYKDIDKDKEVSFGLSKYKDQLLDTLKKNDVNNNHLITFDILRKIVQDLNIILDDESMEYLIYRMKKDVPENNSIFDLNYEIIEKLLEKNEIGEIFINLKNNLINKNTSLDNECQDYLNAVEFQEIKILIIKREDFFKVLEKLEVSVTDELKKSIYEYFKIELESNENPVYWMEYDKIKIELENEK